MFPETFRFILILSLLGGCTAINDKVTSFMGGEDNARPPTPLESFTPQIDVRQLWEKNTGSGTDEQYLKLVPVYYNDKIFVADNDGDVLAIDAVSGKIIWERDTDSPITGGPGAGESLVLVGTGKAEVIGMAADTGEILWRSRVTSEVLAAPQISGNIIIVRTIDGKIFGINSGDGNRLWIYDRSVPALTLRGTSAPVIAQGLVVSGFDEGRLAAIELQTGKLVWETRIALGTGRSELERMVDIDSEPVIVDDTIYVATFQGRIAALSLESGRILWTRDVPSYAGICADNNAVYVTDDNSEIWALDRFTGASIWKQDKLSARLITAPENYGNMIAVGDLEGYVHWLAKSSGEIVARKQLSSNKIIAAPISHENTLYSFASDGILAAYASDQAGNIVFEDRVEEETAAVDQDMPDGETEAGPETDESGTGTDEAVAEQTGASGSVAEDTVPATDEATAENSGEPGEKEEAEEEEDEDKGFFDWLFDTMVNSSEEKY